MVTDSVYGITHTRLAVHADAAVARRLTINARGPVAPDADAAVARRSPTHAGARDVCRRGQTRDAGTGGAFTVHAFPTDAIAVDAATTTRAMAPDAAVRAFAVDGRQAHIVTVHLQLAGRRSGGANADGARCSNGYTIC